MRVTCECHHQFVVPDSLAGGIATCPKCGLATSVEGLHDPFWRVLQVVAALVWAVAVGLVYTNAGLMWAVVVGAALAGVFLLIRLGM